jgi:alkylated DNA repair dioxygenase AlkB
MCKILQLSCTEIGQTGFEWSQGHPSSWHNLMMFQSNTLRGAEILYDPEFLGMADADHFQEDFSQNLDWEQRSIKIFGRPVAQPRLTAWYGEADYTYSGLHWAARAWPEELKRLKTKVENHCGERFNSVLANLYRDGRDSVGWHSDDEPELGPEPVIASVSLGVARTFQMKHKSDDAEWKVLLTHGSLLLMKGPTQQNWKHALPKDKKIREPRINLTFRRIVDSGISDSSSSVLVPDG